MRQPAAFFARRYSNVRSSPCSVETIGVKPSAWILALENRLPFHMVLVL